MPRVCRIVRAVADGWRYQSDLLHAERLIMELACESAKTLPTTSETETTQPDEDTLPGPRAHTDAPSNMFSTQPVIGTTSSLQLKQQPCGDNGW